MATARRQEEEREEKEEKHAPPLLIPLKRFKPEVLSWRFGSLHFHVSIPLGFLVWSEVLRLWLQWNKNKLLLYLFRESLSYSKNREYLGNFLKKFHLYTVLSFIFLSM